jgi:hypothetical protein
MRRVLLIAVILNSLLLSCGIFAPSGIFDPEVNVRTYKITEVWYDKPIKNWLNEINAYQIESFDWPEKIELTRWDVEHNFKGRVKMHFMGWFPIKDVSVDGHKHFMIDIKNDDFYLLTGMLFAWNTIDEHNLEGTFIAMGPTLDEVLGVPYHATR